MRIDYQTVDADPLRDRESAETRFHDGVQAMDDQEWKLAEKFLTESLAADVTFAPSHLALGKVYYLQKRFYLAAWEFEYAQDLQPDRPESYNNLGLVFEAVGKLENAADQYSMAHSMEPDFPDYLGNMVRAKFRLGDRSDELRFFMERIVFVDPRPDWRNWAEHQLVSNEWGLSDVGPLAPPQRTYEEIEPQPQASIAPNLSGPVEPFSTSRR